MFKGTLERIESTNQNLRTKNIVGVFERLPKCGERFLMFAAALDPDMDLRRIETSLITECATHRIDYLGIAEFSTMNSTYKLTFEEEMD